MTKYRVMRDHHGDRFYREGDMREAAPADVAHLIARGVLVALGVKDAPAVQNKAAQTVQTKAGGTGAKKAGR